MGKGSKQRPTNMAKYQANWVRVYDSKNNNRGVKQDPPKRKTFAGSSKQVR
jgi:hypothetical protein